MTTATAPASAANLGPGFDVLAIALDLRCRVTARPSEVWEAFGSDGLPDADLLKMVVGVAGEASPHRVEVESDIPIGVGLGSSAAIRVAAAAALDAASGRYQIESVFSRAAGQEGHRDNAAAATYGGFVAAGPSGEMRRLAVHASLSLVMAIPDHALSTPRARAALDAVVDREVAVRTAARVAFLIEGLRTGDRDALAAAHGDELHEKPRREISPVTSRLVEAALDAGALHAAWSGAGPSAIAFVTEFERDRVVAAMEAALDGEGEVSTPEIARAGVLVG